MPKKTSRPSAAKPFSRESLIAYIHDNPAASGRRDIARAFGLRKSARKALNEMLREIEDEGMVSRGRKRKRSQAKYLPDTVIVEIIGIDGDGEPLARPLEWSGAGEAPPIVMLPERGGRDALAVGDRVLARLTKSGPEGYVGRTLRRIPHGPDRVLGIYRRIKGEGRLIPTDRRVKSEFKVSQVDSKGARDGDLVQAGLSEEKKAKEGQAIGTTGSGIGPAYADKASRIGIRAGDLLEVENLQGTLKQTLDHHNAVITKVYGESVEPFDQAFEQCKEWAGRLASYIGPVEDYVSETLQSGKTILIEGAQGAMLDVGLGTYPFVTSSSPTIGGICTGLGIPARRIDSVIGVLKAYSTRVGEGPFVTELDNKEGKRIRDLGDEFGVNTGRPRRIGWLDLPAARYSAQINGYTSLALTRLDILDHFTTIKICTEYLLDGERINRFPSDVNALNRCEPIWEEVRGWNNRISGATHLEDVPEGARVYIDRIEELVGIPVSIVSTGPKRHETILVRNVF